MNQFNWDQAFTLDFDLNNGLSKHADTTKRYLSQMKNMYQDQEAVEEILKHEDPLIYEFYELGCPERAGDLAFGTTMIHPGKSRKRRQTRRSSDPDIFPRTLQYPDCS